MTKRYIPIIIVAILVILLISTGLSMVWYKSFCTLEQTIDWNAISSITGVFIAISTVGAVFIAIYVPAQDRILSSKIELFNDRFETFHFLQSTLKYSFEEIDRNYDKDEMLKNINRCHFLISKEDYDKLGPLIETIKTKYRERYKVKNKPDLSITINEDLSALANIFEKYLDLRGYGIVQKKR